MAEKAAPAKKKTAAAAKQEMQAALLDVEKIAEERREAETTPAQRIEQRTAQAAVASADALTLENVVKDITQLRSSVGRTLSQIAESLEAEVDKYQQVKKAIEVKEKELAEIYDIQRQAVSLTALIEAQQRKREQFDADMAAEKEQLEREIAETRATWETESKDREFEIKEQAGIDTKARQRERDEYQYKFTREQQQAKDQFADEKARIERELTLRREELERQLGERESAIAAREKQLADLQQRVERFPAELDAAVAKAAKDTGALRRPTPQEGKSCSSASSPARRTCSPPASHRWNRLSRTRPTRSSSFRRSWRRPTARCRRSRFAPSKARQIPRRWSACSSCSASKAASPKARADSEARPGQAAACRAGNG